MARPCSICKNMPIEKRRTVDGMLRDGKPVAEVARIANVSWDCMSRHKHHVRDPRAYAGAIVCGNGFQPMFEDFEKAISQAREKDDLKALVALQTQKIKLLELYSKQPQINAEQGPPGEWVRIRSIAWFDSIIQAEDEYGCTLLSEQTKDALTETIYAN